ncbi:protein phosphatase CheZ [Rhodovibrionaceae bacterium A322]
MSTQTDTGHGDLEDRLNQLVKRHENLDPNDLIEAVESIMKSAQGDLSSVNLKLYSEIEDLAEYIQSARAEIASLRPDEITAQHLPVAGEELEAIVGATEQATNSIMEAVEEIEAVADTLEGEAQQKVVDAVTKVYESCGFQDITGQRISKVVMALQHIETKVHALLSAFGHESQNLGDHRPAASPADDAPKTDEDLMNGPQMDGDAISQDDIDKLLASFD